MGLQPQNVDIISKKRYIRHFSTASEAGNNRCIKLILRGDPKRMGNHLVSKCFSEAANNRYIKLILRCDPKRMGNHLVSKCFSEAGNNRRIKLSTAMTIISLSTADGKPFSLKINRPVQFL